LGGIIEEFISIDDGINDEARNSIVETAEI